MSSPVVDILIIGGGPGGLSTASTIVRQAHSTIIIDSGSYRNDSSPMHTVPTWDHGDPREFREAARKGLERYGCAEYVNAEVASVKKTDEGYFEATGTKGEVWRGHKLILATGIIDIMPDIDGYADCWVSGIFHCLFCHGWDERHAASSGVLAQGDMGSALVSLHVARQAIRLTPVTTIYTLGNEQLANDIKAASSVPSIKVDSRAVKKLTKDLEGSKVTLHFEDGTSYTEGFLSHKPQFKLKGPFAEQLGLDKTPQGLIKVESPFNQTSVKGCFAAGDASNSFQVVTQAIASGTASGGSALFQLQAEVLGQKGFL